MSSNENIPQVGEPEAGEQTSQIIDEGKDDNSTPVVAGAICWFNGKQYGQGAQICSAGTKLFCNVNGNWQPMGKC